MMLWRSNLVKDETLWNRGVSYLRGIIGILGVVLFWSGSWEIFDHLSLQGYKDGPSNYSFLKETLLFTVGLIVLLLTNGLFVDASCNIHYLNWHSSKLGDVGNFSLAYIQSIFSLAGSITYWVGLSNLFEVYIFPKTFLWDGLAVGIGTILMMLSGTFLVYTGVYTSDPVDWRSAGWKSKTKLYMQAMCSSCGGVLGWKGLNNILGKWTISKSLGREIAYTVIGFAFVLFTSTSGDDCRTQSPSQETNSRQSPTKNIQVDSDMEPSNVAIQMDTLELSNKNFGPLLNSDSQVSEAPIPLPPENTVNNAISYSKRSCYSKFTLYIYSFFGFIASLTFMTGLWNIFADYIWINCLGRQIIYMLLGFFALVTTQALLANAGITPATLATQRSRKKRYEWVRLTDDGADPIELQSRARSDLAPTEPSSRASGSPPSVLPTTTGEV